MASIITLRIIMVISSTIISTNGRGGYYTTRPCAEILFIYAGSREMTSQLYPTCESYFNGSNPEQVAIVHADFNGPPEQVAGAMGETFGMAFWLALAIHAFGVELYVSSLVILD
jgi:hypothetical protein